MFPTRSCKQERDWNVHWNLVCAEKRKNSSMCAKRNAGRGKIKTLTSSCSRSHLSSPFVLPLDPDRRNRWCSRETKPSAPQAADEAERKTRTRVHRRSSWLIIQRRSSSNGSDLLQSDLLGAVFFFVFRLLESHHLSLSHSFFHFPCLSLSCSEAAAAPPPSPSPEFFVPQFPLLRAALSSRVHRQVGEGEL